MVRPKADVTTDEVGVTIRFPRHVHAAAKRLADDDQRSLNLWIVRAIAKAAGVSPDPERDEKKASRR